MGSSKNPIDKALEDAIAHGVRLIKAFEKITDPAKRMKVIDLAEALANEKVVGHGTTR